MFKLTIYEEPSIAETIIKTGKQLDEQPKPSYIVVRNPEVVDILLDSMDSQFKLTISEYEPLPESDDPFPTPEVHRTHIDIEKYDSTEPERFAVEVKELVEAGKDFKTTTTIGSTAGMTAAQKYQHHWERIVEKRSNGIKPSFWDIRLANVAVMALRVGFESTKVFCHSEFTTNGIVVDAAPDGSQVRLLFEVPAVGYDNLLNQRYLPRHTAMWFNLPEGVPAVPTVSFVLPTFNTPTRGHTKPGLRG